VIQPRLVVLLGAVPAESMFGTGYSRRRFITGTAIAAIIWANYAFWFRLDRIADTRTLPGSFEPPAGLDPAQDVQSGLARTPCRHEVIPSIQGTVEQIRSRLPASIAAVEELPPAGSADAQNGRWLRVQLNAERLDWLPPLLASLDRPFGVERPDERRVLIAALASRLAASARRGAPCP
jgi:predicted DNA-binding transcriptional regulator YafY